jgi:hypothetical protein
MNKIFIKTETPKLTKKLLSALKELGYKVFTFKSKNINLDFNSNDEYIAIDTDRKEYLNETPKLIKIDFTTGKYVKYMKKDKTEKVGRIVYDQYEAEEGYIMLDTPDGKNRFSISKEQIKCNVVKSGSGFKEVGNVQYYDTTLKVSKDWAKIEEALKYEKPKFQSYFTDKYNKAYTQVFFNLGDILPNDKYINIYQDSLTMDTHGLVSIHFNRFPYFGAEDSIVISDIVTKIISSNINFSVPIKHRKKDIVCSDYYENDEEKNTKTFSVIKEFNWKMKDGVVLTEEDFDVTMTKDFDVTIKFKNTDKFEYEISNIVYDFKMEDLSIDSQETCCIDDFSKQEVDALEFHVASMFYTDRNKEIIKIINSSDTTKENVRYFLAHMQEPIKEIYYDRKIVVVKEEPKMEVSTSAEVIATGDTRDFYVQTKDFNVKRAFCDYLKTIGVAPNTFSISRDMAVYVDLESKKYWPAKFNASDKVISLDNHGVEEAVKYINNSQNMESVMAFVNEKKENYLSVEVELNIADNQADTNI